MDARTTPNRSDHSWRDHGVATPPRSLLLAVLLTGAVSAQTTPPAPTSRPGAATLPSDHALDPNRDHVRLRAPLLREGSQLVGVIGAVWTDDDGARIFTIEASQPGTPRYELTFMPSAMLGEMEQMIDVSGGDNLVFEITGQVYVYRERNYLLPTHPPLLIGRSPADMSVIETAVDSAEPEGDTTADIIRDLERSIGPIARRSAASRTTPFGTYDLEPGDVGPALEGKILVERRGIIRRTGGGAYVLIFDADAEGGADPPMRLLPCLLLERLEDYARRGGERASVLISGHVYSYRGRNYLRPTVFRAPYDRTQLQP